MSDDLVARLRHAWDERERQLAEDERVALEASRFDHDDRPQTPTGEHWQWVEGENDRVIPIDPVTDEYVGESLGEFRVSLRSVEEYPTNMPYTLPHFVIHTAEEVPAICGLHIARHDPARVLAEVERGRRDLAAKRRMLHLHSPLADYKGRVQCEYCAGLCHSRSGLGCDDPADAMYPCNTARLLADAEGLA